MAGNLFDLARMLERLSLKTETVASDAAVSAATAVLGDLAFKTPVDTSQALSSWIVTLDSPSSIVGKAHYPGEYGSTQKASAQETLRIGKMTLLQKKPGQVIYITNNQPYIVRLNEGWSQQQPAGFVERAVAIGRRIIGNFKIK